MQRSGIQGNELKLLVPRAPLLCTRTTILKWIIVVGLDLKDLFFLIWLLGLNLFEFYCGNHSFYANTQPFFLLKPICQRSLSLGVSKSALGSKGI